MRSLYVASMLIATTVRCLALGPLQCPSSEKVITANSGDGWTAEVDPPAFVAATFFGTKFACLYSQSHTASLTLTRHVQGHCKLVASAPWARIERGRGPDGFVSCEVANNAKEGRETLCALMCLPVE